MILSAISEKPKRRSKDDFKGRHFEASLILQAVSWYLRYPLGDQHNPSCGLRQSLRQALPGCVARRADDPTSVAGGKDRRRRA